MLALVGGIWPESGIGVHADGGVRDTGEPAQAGQAWGGGGAAEVHGAVSAWLAPAAACQAWGHQTSFHAVLVLT